MEASGQLHAAATWENDNKLWTTLIKRMKLCPSWEANTCLASPEIPGILWNPKIHYCVHKSL
jgi:hypothetical protein